MSTTPITDLQGCFTLHNNVPLPYFGLGVYQAAETELAVEWAIEAGYRLIDTAAVYNNEQEVGIGIRNGKIDRDQVFVTSKVWNSDQGYEETLAAFQASLERCGLDYLDLYLIHWPVAGKYKETWKALEELYQQGKVRAIGVSNFLQVHLEDLLTDAKVVPMVNQIEFHPRLVQQSLLDFCSEKSIVPQAWSPLMRGAVMEIPEITAIAKAHGKSNVQVVLRWSLQKGVATIPKSSNKSRIISNADVFDFELSQEEITVIDRLDRQERTGPDPMNFDF